MPNDRSKTIEIAAVPIPPSEHDPAPATVRHSHEEILGDSASVQTEKAMPVAPTRGRERATLTVMTGISAGLVVSIDEHGLTAGRGLDTGLVLDDPAISRRHASFEPATGGGYLVRDLSSTNGTFVGGQRVDESAIASGDRVQLGPNVLLRFAITDETEESLLRRLYESSTRDALTGAFNRKYFFDRLKTELAYANRHKTALAVLVIDVDHFKHTNDVHGHMAGDHVLRGIALRLGTVVRREDIVARIGGEELAVLARGGSALDATRLAERLRSAVETLQVPIGERVLAVTVSIGVARLDECPSGRDEEMFALADTRLYEAKRAGRNRVVAQ
jgi:diguanylate cyclase (GGDEF)-like protein